jgi:hypothetical protein
MGHFCRKAGGVDAQIHERMYNDRHSKRADNQYQHFRVHLEGIPVLIGLLTKRGDSKICPPRSFACF